MSPRAYQSVQRQAVVEQTRERIIDAAYDLLATGGSFAGFTVDAVARQANVARMTVYYQFGSKTGLLEALCDRLATRGGMDQLGRAFGHTEPLAALAEFIAVFARFWETDRLVTRRLRALGALDPEFALVLRARDERRREGVRVLVHRLAERYGRPVPEEFAQVVDVLYTLIGFETFDLLAGDTRRPIEVTPIVQGLVMLALDLAPGAAKGF